MEIIEKIARILESLDILAFVGIILTVFFAIHRKSYEIMITHRLKSLDKIREDMAKLTYLFSVDGIIEYKTRNDNIQAYNADIKKLICALHMEIKPLYVQEIELWGCVEETWIGAKKYFAESVEANGDLLTQKAQELQDKYDLYDWALWLYIQQLHKDPKNKTELFNDLYEQVKLIKENAEAEIAAKSK